MLSSQAMAAVGAMMTAFGGAGGSINNSDIGCVAEKIWLAGRNGSFAHKLELAKDALSQFDFNPKNCARPDPASAGSQIKVEFRHRRDSEAWNDAILATLTVINAAQQSNYVSAPAMPVEWREDVRATLLGDSNILLFWQNTPILGIEVEPESHILEQAAAPVRG